MPGIVSQAGMFIQPLPPVDYETGLVAWWQLEEATFPRLDSYGVQNITFGSGSPGVESGIIGNAVSLDGTQSLDKNDTPELSITGALTISAWVKIDSIGAVEPIVTKWGGSGNSYDLKISSGGVILFRLSQDGSSITEQVFGDTTVPTNTWFHVLAVYDPSNYARVYLNGVLDKEETATVPASLHDGTGAFRIGRQDTLELAGAIDEVAIWNAARDELASPLYNGGAGVSISSLGLSPDADLDLTSTHATGTILNSVITDRTQPCVWAVDLTIPGSPSGAIFEMGGGGTGAYFGFRADGSFIARAGDGTPSAPTASGAGMAVVHLTSGQPTGTGRLVVEFNPANDTVRVWWNRVLIGTGTATSNISNWTGTGDGGFDATDGGVCTGEETAGLGASYLTNLRYYENQTVSI